jgi:hypothetical protein
MTSEALRWRTDEFFLGMEKITPTIVVVINKFRVKCDLSHKRIFPDGDRPLYGAFLNVATVA